MSGKMAWSDPPDKGDWLFGALAFVTVIFVMVVFFPVWTN